MGRLSAKPRRTKLKHLPSRGRAKRRSRVRTFLRDTAINGRLPAFLLSVGLSVLVVGLLVSDDFIVQRVIVEGNNVAYADSIVSTSDALGQSVFHLDTVEISQRVVTHPAVVSAEVSAMFPDRVIVRLQERLPALVWQFGDRAVLVDEYGWVIAEGYDPELPRVVLSAGPLPEPNSKLSTELVDAVHFVGNELQSDLATLEYDIATGLIAHLDDGRSIVLGNSDQIPLKLSVLEASMSLANRWTKLDVREPDRPYFQ